MLFWVLVLAFGSGCAALVYEVIWLQQLQLVIGSSAVSLGLLLATFMGGLCIGSFAVPRTLPSRRHPLWLYGWIELTIAGLAILILFGVPLIGAVYVTSAGQGFVNVLSRGIVAAICLLPPTILMGMTFPILARSVRSDAGASRIGMIYTANISGAVVGCWLAGFYLLPAYDLGIATFTAVAINGAVGIGSLLLSRILAAAPSSSPQAEITAAARPATPIYIALALSGASALGAQVVWTRLLSVLFGATAYTFSIILSVFLIGLGVGSAAGAWLARSTQRPMLALTVCQTALAASIGMTGWMISRWLPYWPVDPTLALSSWAGFQVDLLRTLWTILPATVLWGATFPLALAALVSPTRSSDRLAGHAYAANTLGAIAGALAFTFVAVPGLGTQRSQQLIGAIALVAAGVVLASLSRRSSPNAPPDGPVGIRTRSAVAAVLLLALALIAGIAEIPWQVIAYGRRIAPMMYADRDNFREHPIRVLRRSEGLDSSVVITEQAGQRILYVNGSTEASNAPDDMRLQRMAGHLPALIHGNPQQVLVVGFGTGVTAGSFVTYPELRRIVVAELEASIPAASAEFFARENYGVYADDRVDIVHDDGRHFLLTTEETFDVITSDPVHLYVRGTSALYSKEYFELVRRRLKPAGVMAQWLPLYDGGTETLKSALATFFSVFPEGTVWSNHTQDRGYDLVLLGQAQPRPMDVDFLWSRWTRPDYRNVVLSMRSVGFNSPLHVLSAYLGRASDLRPWLADAQLNLDRNLRLQYLAGVEMNAGAAPALYGSLAQQRTFPHDLFTGSEEVLQALRSMLDARR